MLVGVYVRLVRALRRVEQVHPRLRHYDAIDSRGFPQRQCNLIRVLEHRCYLLGYVHARTIDQVFAELGYLLHLDGLACRVVGHLTGG